MQEKHVSPIPGAAALLVWLAIEAGSFYWFNTISGYFSPLNLIPIGIIALSPLLLIGFYTLQPNEARVLILFGNYRGTVKKAGWHWGNPFYSNGAPTLTITDDSKPNTKASSTSPFSGGSKAIDSRYKVSLRARTNLGEVIKVNDRRGNPIEIGAVVVWRVADTAKAVFEVDDYRTYVKTQVETTLRHVATQFNYDHSEAGELSQELTLRGNPEEVAAELRQDLTGRLAVAGVVIDDARLTHLAYAPEIAQAMLRRQQADAVISARRKIVQGAVGMVEMALEQLEKSASFTLDDDRRASMVSNLMVVLCGEKEASPVINAGTLYS
jgi:regulator of protease activity HflC (stomatin/prohibitin superfamily)